MKSNDWKERLNVVYSTNPDFNYETNEELEEETLAKDGEIIIQGELKEKVIELLKKDGYTRTK